MIRHIQYVGGKECRVDTLTGSGLVWQRDEVLPVPASVARELLKYPDIWAEVTAEDHGQGELFQASTLDTAALLEECKTLRERVAELEEERTQLLCALASYQTAASGETELPAQRPDFSALNEMRKGELAEYALRHYGLEFDPKMTKEAMRDRLIAEKGKE